jgi:hypothetical protein
MELRIEPYSTPEKITFNYEELKGMLLEKAEHYASIVYNEDQIKDAKADRANLNRLKKALNDERLKREREYMESFNVFKAQINEIIGIIDKPASIIDGQVKAFEERQKEEKLEAIKAYWESKEADGEIKFALLFDEKWLNASVKMSAIEKVIDEKLAQIASDLDVIEDLPYFAFEAKEAYLSHLDLGKAISEAHRLQAQAEKKAAWEAEQAKRKAEVESTTVNHGSSKPSEPIKEEEPKKSWIAFKALLSVEDANALRIFFEERHIEFTAI